MDEATPLDLAHAAMAAAPGAEGPRRAFLGQLLAAELFLLVEREVEGATVAPRVFPVEEGPLVLAFDREDRLAAFAGAPVPYAALPGRALVPMLAAQGLGLGLNLEVAPSAELLTPAAVAWLAARLDEVAALSPAAAALSAEALGPPADGDAALAAALAPVLARASGLVAAAWLVSAPLPAGGRGPLLVLAGAAPGAEATLARAVAEAALFGAAGAALSLVVLPPGDALARAAARIGLAIEMPPRTPPAPPAAAPGLDPARPPILRRGRPRHGAT